MKTLAVTAFLFLFALGFAQDKPQEIAKNELPKKPVASFCGANGGTEMERPNVGYRYKGKAYYFCDRPALDAFLKDPEGFLPLPVPRRAPDFAVKTLAGESVSLTSFKGKAVLLDFWATWCAPCLATMPELQKLHERYAGKGLVVLGVSIDEKGAKAVKPFMEKRKLSYAIALDSSDKPAWKSYRVKGIPMLFLIDREGVIVKQWTGKPERKEVEEAVQSALK